MINAIIQYVIEIDHEEYNITRHRLGNIKRLSRYAISQTRFEVRFVLNIIIFILTSVWTLIKFCFFWIPAETLYAKYRSFIQNIPIVSSVLMMYETIVFMICFEENQKDMNEL